MVPRGQRARDLLNVSCGVALVPVLFVVAFFCLLFSFLRFALVLFVWRCIFCLSWKMFVRGFGSFFGRFLDCWSFVNQMTGTGFFGDY